MEITVSNHISWVWFSWELNKIWSFELKLGELVRTLVNCFWPNFQEFESDFNICLSKFSRMHIDQSGKKSWKIPCRISFSWLHFFCRFVQTKKTCPIVLSYVVLNSRYKVHLLCLVNPSGQFSIFFIPILTPERSEKLLDLILSYHVGTYS